MQRRWISCGDPLSYTQDSSILLMAVRFVPIIMQQQPRAIPIANWDTAKGDLVVNHRNAAYLESFDQSQDSYL